MNSRLSPWSALTALLVAAVAPTTFANNYSGALSDATTGPIPAGVHQITAASSIPTGSTLTIQPGAILKFGVNCYITLDGTLHANGTGANPITMTSIHDDTIGGDTNGNGGATGPAKGQWYGLLCHVGGAASTLSNVEMRYTGAANYGALQFENAGASITATNCAFRHGAGPGINMGAFAAYPTISNCTFDDLNGWAVDNCRIDSVPGFTNNTANNGLRSIHVTVGNVGSSVSIGPASNLGGAIVMATPLAIGATGTLTVAAGTVFKMEVNQYVVLDGTLDANGTVPNPVVFTSIHDDTIGGDTNGNGGATGPAKGQWYGFLCHPGGSASTLDSVETRYTGAANYGAYQFEQPGSNLAITNCLIRLSAGPGMNMGALSSFPTVSQCTFDNLNGWPVDNCLIDAVPGFTNNTAINTQLKAIHVTGGTLGSNVSLTTANCVNGAIAIATPLNIPASRTLTLGAGVVMKFEVNQDMVVDGTLNVNGTPANRVVFTSIHDDTIMGDSNGNGGATGPAKGQWYGIFLNATAAGLCQELELRFTGAANYGAVHYQAGGQTIAFHALTVKSAAGAGINLNNQATFPSIVDSTIIDVNGYAVEGGRLDTVAGIVGLTTSATQYKGIHISSATMSQDATLNKFNVHDSAFVVEASPVIPAGVRLTLGDGAILKMGGNQQLQVLGALDALGTPEDPITFTSIHDDSVGGDANGNGGATGGAPGQWYFVDYQSGGAASEMRHVVVRYGGAANYPSFFGHSANLTTRAVRVERAAGPGFALNAGVSHADLTAWSCGGDGFHLESGNFLLRRATAANCPVGARVEAAFTGAVASSVFFNNTTNIIGGTASTYFFSDGVGAFAGSFGNLNVNPLFRNVAAGDLRLSNGSPCVDKGDSTDIPLNVRDSAGFPRYLDGDLDSNPRVDMGAYEFDNVELTVTGTFTPGGSMTIAVDETASFTTLMFIGDTFLAQNVHPAGALYVGFTGSWVMIGWPSGSTSFTFGIPTWLPSPQTLTLQALGYPNLGAANFSNPKPLVIQ